MAGQGKQISDSEIIARLKLSGIWFGAQSELEDEALIAQAAKKEGLSISDAELQEDFDAFRASRGLEKAADTHEWLKQSGLKVEEVESFLEAGLLSSKLAQKVISDASVEAYYKQNPQEFEYAQISQLIVSDAGAAQELALSAKEEGENFADLARKHSIDKGTKSGGGFAGLITRRTAQSIPAEIADKIFAAAIGDIVGPFAVGKNHCVMNVLEVGRRPLDDGLRSMIRMQLFGRWLSEKNAA